MRTERCPSPRSQGAILKVSAKIVTPPRGLFKLVAIDGKGRGIITTEAIRKGAVIEAAPVIRLRKKDRPTARSVLSHYPFEWDEPPYVVAFALGYVGLLNHSDEPNCRIEVDYDDQVLRVFARRNIKAGEELMHNYGVDPWFDVA